MNDIWASTNATATTVNLVALRENRLGTKLVTRDAAVKTLTIDGLTIVSW